IGDDQIEWCVGTEDRMVEAFSRCGDDVFAHTIENGVFGGNGDCNRVDIGGKNRDRRKFRDSDCQHRASCSKIKRIGWMLALNHFLNHFKAAGCGAMVASTKSKSGIDQNRNFVWLQLVAIMRAMHEEAG